MFDKVVKHMFYKVLVGTWGDWEKVKDDQDYISCSVHNGFWMHFEPYMKWCVLMQSTGLFDRNGKEIFEGDVVSVAGIDLAIVQFDAENYSAFILKPIGEYYFDNSLLAVNLQDLSLDIKVVGNIFEHPHLLGKLKQDENCGSVEIKALKGDLKKYD